MSRKTSASAPKIDRRVQRTQHLLGDALVKLMHEKPFDAITIQNVLDRAEVGRSTFYTHFLDKDDLFVTGVDQFFERMANLPSRSGEVSRRVAPVRELFSHIAEARAFVAALRASGKFHDVMELAQGHFARAIEQRLTELSALGAPASTPYSVVSQALAGALLSLMLWWVDGDMQIPPAQMDDIFHQMVWSGVNAQVNHPLSSEIR